MMTKMKRFSVPGFTAGAVSAGIKKRRAADMAVIFSEAPATAAGVFTTNRVKAAPVLLSQVVAKTASARAIVVNSGNANACNGEAGMVDALETAHVTAESLGVDTSDVFVCSTGVIGAPLAMAKIKKAVPRLCGKLAKDGFEDAARAMMTTDTFHKIYGVRLKIGGKTVSVAGMAKGAGMIEPNMATMLGFIVTDAAVEKSALHSALKDAADASFNTITIDGDTSTNDSVIALANGMAKNAVIEKGGPGYGEFAAAMADVCLALAKMIVKDGEGATKFVEIEVKGAKSEAEAKKAAKTIANSPLVKTAMFAADPNWGRIMAAAGRSGAEFDPDAVQISFGKVALVKGGVGLGKLAEAKAAAVMKKPEYKVTVSLGAGEASARVFTTDLSFDYVKINAEYRS